MEIIMDMIDKVMSKSSDDSKKKKAYRRCTRFF
jgi:hypothetical protein